MSTDISRAMISHDGREDGVRHLAPDGRVTQITRNGRDGHGGYGLLAPETEATAPSRLLAYLPAIYSADEFVGRFLRIFQDTLDPIDDMIDNLPDYFDPRTAPPELVDWLAHWVGLQETFDWTLAQRRALIMRAVKIYGSRGTAEGLKLHLEPIVGTIPLVMENTDGFRLTSDARMGYNTMLGSERPSWFALTIVTEAPQALQDDILREIIDLEKPVGTAYTLHIVQLRNA